MRLIGTLAARAAAASVGLLKATPANGDESAADGVMEISATASRPVSAGLDETFIGEVSLKPLFGPIAARTAGAAEVSFTPCARTAWHTHPGGQTLVVTAGEGWIQQWDGVKQTIKTGDVIWTPPRVKHWHGVTDTTTMTHIAIQDTVDGRPVD